MGSGDSHLMQALRHHLHAGGGSRKEQPHHHQHHQQQIPKGCVAVMVGQDGEEQQRFVVPVEYLSHPLFVQLLKDAEDEYGFEHQGAIALPCHVAQFLSVQGLIDRDHFLSPHHHHHHQVHHHHHHHLVGCFRA